MNRSFLHKANSGFTLIELITVIVVLSIVGGIGSSFLITSINSYNDVQEKNKMISKGRLVLEQMTRQLRIAVPNSLRVSPSGNCIEFLPIAGGANYLTELPDTENGAPEVSSVTTSPFVLGLSAARHVVVGALNVGDIYTLGSPASRVSIAALSAGPPYSSVSFTANHRFISNSINQRIYIADDPIRFCLSGGSVIEYSGYGLNTSAMADAMPAGATPSLMANLVTTDGTAFILSPGSEDRNTAVFFDLTFMEGSHQVRLEHQVLVRNVP